MLFINHIELLDNRAAIIEIKGPLNGTNVADFQDYTGRLIEKNIVYLMVDAAGLDYLSSEGIGMFLLLQKSLGGINGFFTIFNLNDEITSLCTLLGFNALFHIAKSRDEALHLVDRQMDLRAAAREITPPVPETGPVEGIDAHDRRETIVVDCSRCGALLRVGDAGDYTCPDCGSSLSYSPEKGMAPVDSPPEVKELEPFVTECARCKMLIRIRMTGDYNCPHCGAPFSVGADHHVSWSS